MVEQRGKTQQQQIKQKTTNKKGRVMTSKPKDSSFSREWLTMSSAVEHVNKLRIYIFQGV